MLNPTWYPSDGQLRQFAVISLFGFGIGAVVATSQSGLGTLAYVLATIGLVVFVVGLVSPRKVMPVYVTLIGVTLPIGWLLSNVLIRVMYYGIMTPMGVLSRLVGRDPLRLKRPEARSCWQERRQRTDVASYYRQA